MKRYFTEKDYDKLIYFQMPKLLIYSDKYKHMSNDAKILYTVCLDLIKFSMQNHGTIYSSNYKQIWKDEKGYFIKLPIKTISEILNCGRDKAIKLKQELEEYDLLEQKRVGVQKANLLYVLQLDYSEEDIYIANDKHEKLLHIKDEKQDEKSSGSNEVGKTDFKKSENPISRSRKNRLQEVGKSDSIKNDLIEIDLIKNDHKKNLSIKEKEIEKLNLPMNIKKQLIQKIDRLIDDNIDIFEIELFYHSIKEHINNFEFAYVLFTVLNKTKKPIKNISNLLAIAIKNRVNQLNNSVNEKNEKDIETDNEPEYKKRHKEEVEKIKLNFEEKKRRMEEILKKYS